MHKRDKDKKELIERAEDFEQLAMKRLEKVRCIDTSSSPPIMSPHLLPLSLALH